MTGEDFVTLAGKLAAAAHAGEATYRTAVSRSYYGSFHVVRNFFTAMGLKLSRDHGDYQRCLMAAGNSQASIMGEYLTDLHSYRIRADYELTDRKAGSPQHARECVELATKLCAIIERLTDADHTAIRDGIEAHRQKIAAGKSRQK